MNSLEVILWILSLFLGALTGHFLYASSGFKLLWIAIIVIPIIFILLFGLWLVFLFVWGKFFNMKKPVTKFSKFYYHIVYVTDATFMRIINVGVKLKNYDKMPNNHDYVLVCNHISNFDS